MSNMQIKPVDRNRLADHVVLALEKIIAKGELRPKAQLPTEHELSERFSVSRNVVREAVARLQSDGYVEVRQGSGTYVAEYPGLKNFRMPDPEAVDSKELSDIFELRIAIETEAAKLAAQRRTMNDLRQMRKALKAMQAAIDQKTDGMLEDDAFHRAIAAASKNPYIERFVAFLSHHFAATRARSWSTQGRANQAPQLAQAGHQKLFEAIQQGNPIAAEQAVREHLQASQESSKRKPACKIKLTQPFLLKAKSI